MIVKCSMSLMLVILAIASTSLEIDILNLGVTTPCIFYLPSHDKIFNLYSMEQNSHYTISPADNNIKIYINFCEPIRKTSELLPIEATGSIWMEDQSKSEAIAFSYFNGLLNSTTWNITAVTDELTGDFQGIDMSSYSPKNSNPAISNMTIRIFCNPDIKGDSYMQTTRPVGWEKNKQGQMTYKILLSSSQGCGYPVPKFFNTIAETTAIYYVYLGLTGLVMLLIGYKVLKIGLIIFGFVTGFAITAAVILQGSNPNLWGIGSYIFYSLFATMMGVILSHSSYHFTSWVGYIFSVYIGTGLAIYLNDQLNSKKHFYGGYILVHIVIPLLFLFIFYKNKMNSRFLVTSTVGAIFIVVLFCKIFNTSHGHKFSHYMDPIQLMNDNPLLGVFYAILLIIGFASQRVIYEKFQSEETEAVIMERVAAEEEQQN